MGRANSSSGLEIGIGMGQTLELHSALQSAVLHSAHSGDSTGRIGSLSQLLIFDFCFKTT